MYRGCVGWYVRMYPAVSKMCQCFPQVSRWWRRRRRFMAHDYVGARAVPAAYLSGGAGGSLRQALAATPPLAPPPRLQHCNTYSPECPTPTWSSGSARHDTAPQSSSDRQRHQNRASSATWPSCAVVRSERVSTQCMCFPDRRQFDVHVAAPGTY